MPDAVIVGYSSSFSLESEENRQLQYKFKAMGADIVCALDYLTLTPAIDLRQAFENARVNRRAGVTLAKPRAFTGSSREGLKVARRIQTALADEFLTTVWDETVFAVSDVTIESLEKACRT